MSKYIPLSLKTAPLLIALFILVLAGCVSTAPTPTKGDFIDQVLEPLSMRLADEKYAQTVADVNHRCAVEASNEAAQFLKAIPGLKGIMKMGDEKLELAKQAHLAWLETRRSPLKQEIQNTLVTQTEQTGSDFTVCVDGLERHYTGLNNGRFTRLADEGSCAVLEPESLTLPKSNVPRTTFAPPPCYLGN